MTPLRKEMIQDMCLAGLAPSSRKSYLAAVLRFVRHYDGLPPQHATEQHLAQYLLHLQSTVACGTFMVYRYGLVFLFGNTLQRDWSLLKKKYALPGDTAFPTPSNMMFA
jgi:hypothetical protein